MEPSTDIWVFLHHRKFNIVDKVVSWSVCYLWMKSLLGEWCERGVDRPDKETRIYYSLSEARSGVDWADLMAAQGAFGTDFYDKSTRTIVGTML